MLSIDERFLADGINAAMSRNNNAFHSVMTINLFDIQWRKKMKYLIIFYIGEKRKYK